MRHTIHAAIACLVAVSAIAVEARAQDADLYRYDVHGRLIGIQRPTNVTTIYTLDPADNREVRSSFDQVDAVWQAETLPHLIGYAVADGWGANPSSGSGYLTYGPYVTTTPVGLNTASWRIRIDDNLTPGTANVVTMDVWDATAGVPLAARTVDRHAWLVANTYQDIEVPFALLSSASGHALEFRTFYHGVGTVVMDENGYRAGGGVWLAATELFHVIGYANSGDWVADPSMSPNYMTYGPYAGVAPGARTAVWRMKISSPLASSDSIATLDVWDATASEPLGSVTLDLSSWSGVGTFQEFEVPFIQDASRAGHSMEFRTYYEGVATLAVQWIGVR